MATIIKLQRRGAIHRPFWRIVVTDSRKPKGCVEQLGTYDNLHKPIKLTLDKKKAILWLEKGAKPSPAVNQILKKQGIFKEIIENKKTVSN